MYHIENLYSTNLYVVYAPLADVAGWWWTQGGYLHCICICMVFLFVLYSVVYALLGGGLRVGGATILS